MEKQTEQPKAPSEDTLFSNEELKTMGIDPEHPTPEQLKRMAAAAKIKQVEAGQDKNW